jgi:O-antigen/teichoic acid export membrane protein
MTTEPVVMIGTRVAQCIALLAVAASGGAVAVAVGVIALLELAGVLAAGRSLGAACFEGVQLSAIRALPWRRAAALAGVEIVSLAYLRADLLLVGRILGPALGAVYGLVYRVIDGLNGAVGSAGVWLYAETVAERDASDRAASLRARSLTLLPRVAVAVAFVLVLASQVLVVAAPSLASDVRTLQYLIVAFPLLSINAIELHVRSGKGRNREVVWIGCAALATNVVLCLALVPTLGLRGAALALIGSEIVQSLLLLRSSSVDERDLLLRALLLAGEGSALLLALGALLDFADVEYAVIGVVMAVVGVVAWTVDSWRRHRLAVP